MDSLEAATWILAFATLGLLLATGALAWFTKSLAVVTARMASSSERLERQSAEHFRLAGPLLQIAYPAFARWELRENPPGQLLYAFVRFSVKNDGRQPSILAGAYVTWEGSKWSNGIPVYFAPSTLPATVQPGDRAGPFEAEFPVFPDDLETLLAAKKATLFAFTPTARVTEGAEFFVYAPDKVGAVRKGPKS